MRFLYNEEKDLILKKERNIGFEEIIVLIQNGHIFAVFDHPNHLQYPNQKMYALDIEGYVWLVPFVRDHNSIFLKTAFPSRKHTKKFLKEYQS